jgi:hypothetical protein
VPPISELEEDPFPLISPSAREKDEKKTQKSAAPDAEQHAFFTDATEHPPAAIAAAANVAAAGGSERDRNAVSRARKRLRGEPVSPSPVKEKRQRVAERISALSFEVGAAGDDEEQDLVGRGGGEAFIDDTPARPPIGKKQFRTLFDETAVPAGQSSAAARTNPSSQAASSMTRSKSLTAKGLFGFGFSSSRENGAKGLARTRSRALSPTSEHSDEDIDWDASKTPSSSLKLKAPDFSPAVAAKPTLSAKPAKNGLKIPGAVLPGKDDLQSALPPNAPKDATKALTKKRALSPSHGSRTPASRTTPKQSFASLPLLPPSPPPAETQASQQRYADKGKGKALALARKKSKLLAAAGGDGTDDDEDESIEESDAKVKVKEVSAWQWRRHRSRDAIEDLPPSDAPQPDSEPEFDVTRRASVPLRASSPHLDGEDEGGPGDEETFEVSLPDDLRRVLALEPPPHAAPPSAVETEKLVRGLLYGTRAGRYDARRGGEVWDVGECGDGDERADEFAVRERERLREESEEEWEGEPVPWEVGEL